MMVCIYPGPLPDIYAETGTFRERIFKTSFVEIASAVEKMVLLVCPNFEKDDATTSDKSIIHDLFILNLLLLKTVNNFDASRLFGL